MEKGAIIKKCDKYYEKLNAKREKYTKRNKNSENYTARYVISTTDKCSYGTRS
jgi:hypothetical protein